MDLFTARGSAASRVLVFGALCSRGGSSCCGCFCSHWAAPLRARQRRGLPLLCRDCPGERRWAPHCCPSRKPSAVTVGDKSKLTASDLLKSLCLGSGRMISKAHKYWLLLEACVFGEKQGLW